MFHSYTNSYQLVDGLSQDDLDWLVGFSELWLYALRSARLALEPLGTQLAEDHYGITIPTPAPKKE